MDIFNIPSLIAKRKIVSVQDIDPSNAYLQLGVYQPNMSNTGDNAYPSYGIPLSELVGDMVTTNYNDFYSAMSNGELSPGTSYRITDYQSKNYINGWKTAQDNWSAPNLPEGTRLPTYNYPSSPLLDQTTCVYSLATGAVLTGDAYGAIKLLDIDGNIDTHFSANVGSGGNNTIHDIKIQSDGKIIVAGSFSTWNGNPVGYIVRLLSDGTYDPTFTSNLGAGFDNYILGLEVQADDRILCGGGFTNLNGNPQNHFARLNSDGTEDNIFNFTVMSIGGFNGDVFQIIVQPDTAILVRGSFGSYNGDSCSYITRIDSAANIDFTFNSNIIFSGGFNGPLSHMALQNDASIVITGFFTQFNFTSINYVIRLYSDGSEDVSFTGAIGTGPDSALANVVIDPFSANIYLFGNQTSFNSNASQNCTALDTFGNFMSFNYNSGGLSGGINNVCIQATTQNLILCQGNVISVITSPIPFPNYDAREVYISPNVETIVVKALDNYNIEPIAYSEQHPQDIINYLPQVNNLGFSLDVYNYATLPDSSVVSGFDLQWDGTRVYFDMPSNYPVQMGHFFYIYCDFSNGKDLEAYCEPLYFGVNQTTNFNSDLYSSIEVGNNQTRVYLNDISYDQFLLYYTNSLYVNTIYSDTPCTGWIMNRVDTASKITYPADWRNQVYRRYLLTNLDLGVIEWYYPYLSFYSTIFASDGTFQDYPIFNLKEDSIYDINITSIGYTTTWWYGHVDNNVFSQGVNAFSSSSYLSQNTFVNANVVNCFGSLTECYFNYLNVINFSDSSYQNVIVGDFSYTDFGYGFRYNVITSAISNTKVNSGFTNNILKKGNITNVIFGINTTQFTSKNTSYINAVFGNSTYNNTFVNSYIINWQSGLEFQNNTFENATLYNTKIGDNADGNHISDGTWQSNTIDNSFQVNTIKSPEFSYNTIGKVFSTNNIDASGYFKYNTIGSFFSDNHINGSFQNNTLGYGCTENEFSITFEKNVIGDNFSSNYLTGYGSFRYNTIGSECTSNTITTTDFSQNTIGTYFDHNTLSNTFRYNEISSSFGGNSSDASFDSNTITAACTGNRFSNQIVSRNFIGGDTFNDNNIDSSFISNQFYYSFSFNTTAGTYISFRFNEVKVGVIGVDFSSSSYVYDDYNKTIIRGNTGIDQLIYWDDALTSYNSVTPINS